MARTVCSNCSFLEDRKTNYHDPHLSSSVTTDLWWQLADLESEITRVQSLLRHLEQRRLHMKREINDQSLILRLPPEITSEIFVSCLSDHSWEDTVDNYFLPRTQASMPLMFGRICSTWRDIAWSTPTLWCSVELDLDELVDPVLVDQWLTRSGTLPLSICAWVQSDVPNPSVVAIMDIIARRSDRWRNVAFELPSFCYDALSRVKYKLPNLKYFALDNLMWSTGREPKLDMFSFAPSLRNVRMWGFSPHILALPTNQLTALRMDCEYVDSCVAMLQCSPHVIDCTFETIRVPSSGLYHAFTHLLESLVVTFDARDDGPIYDILDAFTIPAVRKLSCSPYGGFPHSNFIHLMTRSSCSLRTLSLTGVYIYDMQLIGCLRAAPSLEELFLNQVTVTNGIWPMLNPSHPLSRAPASTLLPKLTTFECSGPLDNFNLDFSVLESFLRSRWCDKESIVFKDSESSSIARLQSAKFEMIGSGVPDLHTLAQLQQLVEEGMNLKLSTSNGSWV